MNSLSPCSRSRGSRCSERARFSPSRSSDSWSTSSSPTRHEQEGWSVEVGLDHSRLSSHISRFNAHEFSVSSALDSVEAVEEGEEDEWRSQGVPRLLEEAQRHWTCNNFASVLEFTSRALAIDCSVHLAYELRAKAEMKLLDYEAARHDLTRALALPDSMDWRVRARLLHQRALVLRQLGHDQLALDDLEASVLLESNADHARGHATRVVWKPDMLDRAISFSNTFCEGSTPLNATMGVFVRAVIHERRDDLDEALRCWNEALSIWPRDKVALQHRASIHERLGLLERAMSDYCSVLEEDPSAFDAYVGRGNVHTRLGNHLQAIVEYGAALSLRETSALYLERGISYLRTRSQRRPATHNTIRRRAETESSDNMYFLSRAVGDFTRGIELAQSHLRLLYSYRSIALRRLRRFEQALEDSTMSLRIEPNSVQELLNSARIQLRLGRLDDALADVQKALALEPMSERAKTIEAVIQRQMSLRSDNIGLQRLECKGDTSESLPTTTVDQQRGQQTLQTFIDSDKKELDDISGFESGEHPIPSEYLGPITRVPMVDPVVASDGHTCKTCCPTVSALNLNALWKMNELHSSCGSGQVGSHLRLPIWTFLIATSFPIMPSAMPSLRSKRDFRSNIVLPFYN